VSETSWYASAAFPRTPILPVPAVTEALNVTLYCTPGAETKLVASFQLACLFATWKSKFLPPLVAALMGVNRKLPFSMIAKALFELSATTPNPGIARLVSTVLPVKFGVQSLTNLGTHGKFEQTSQHLQSISPHALQHLQFRITAPAEFLSPSHQ
jgi:hypothetical protein